MEEASTVPRYPILLMIASFSIVQVENFDQAMR
jgi:hypothetical protein